MPAPTPPRRKGRPSYAGAAARRVRKGAGPALTDGPKGQGPTLLEQPGTVLTPGKQTPGGRPAATAPGRVITRRAQPTTAPGAVLGASAAAPGDVIAQPSAGVNTGRGGAGGPLGGAERVNKRFTVGFTADGRIVHLYGNDVPAAQRRIVLRKGQKA